MPQEPYTDNLNEKEKRKNSPRRNSVIFLIVGLMLGVFVTVVALLFFQESRPDSQPEFTPNLVTAQSVLVFPQGDMQVYEDGFTVTSWMGGNSEMRQYKLTQDEQVVVTLGIRIPLIADYFEKISVSMDGRYLLQDFGNGLAWFDIATQGIVQSLSEFNVGAWSKSQSPDGFKIILAKPEGSVEIWDATNQTVLSSWDIPQIAENLAVSAQADYWAVVYSEGVRAVHVYDANRRTDVFAYALNEAVNDIYFTADNQLVVLTAINVTVINWQTGQNRVYAVPDAQGQQAVFSADNKWLAVSSVNNVYVLRVDDGNAVIEPDTDVTSPQPLFDYLGTSIVGIGFTADSRLLITAMGNGEVKIWDTTTWELVAQAS